MLFINLLSSGNMFTQLKRGNRASYFGDYVNIYSGELSGDGGVNRSCLSYWMAVNRGSLFLLSPGKTCQCADLAGGSAVSSSTSFSSCCSSSSPLPPSSSTQWTSLMSRDLWRACGSEFSRPALTLSFIPHWCHQLILSLSNPEPSHYPVLPNPSAVGDVSTPALHRLLLCLL